MKNGLGQLEVRLLAYAQMRGLDRIRRGELVDSLQLTPRQATELLSRLARAGIIARVRRGLYLVPPRLPLGGEWTPDEVTALNALIEDREGSYQICGPNTFNRYGFDDQVPGRLYAYNNRLSGERQIGAAKLTLIKVAADRLGGTEESVMPNGQTAVYSSRVRTLVDAVYDWSRFGTLPRAYEWAAAELSARRVVPGELVSAILRYGNQGTIRRCGVLLEREGVSSALLRKLRRALRSSKSLIAWVPDRPRRGSMNRRWGLCSMGDTGSSLPRLHDDTELFREAIVFTAARTGFSPRLVEKDYFCTALLAHLATAAPELVFKGGTCLAKIHAEFYRLSEDMDFVIPVSEDAPRSERSRLAAGAKVAAAALPQSLPAFRVAEKLKGANRSTQYCASFTYVSRISDEEDTIKLEIGLREPLLKPADLKAARTILLNPVSGKEMVPPVTVRCIAMAEAFAEKFRAALTRREVAIRDYYDIGYGAAHLGIEPRDAELVRLVRKKLAVRDNPPVDVGADRLRRLRAQLDTHLRPVLRPRDFDKFDLEPAIGAVVKMAEAVGK